jgi:hypothetical protein
MTSEFRSHEGSAAPLPVATQHPLEVKNNTKGKKYMNLQLMFGLMQELTFSYCDFFLLNQYF